MQQLFISSNNPSSTPSVVFCKAKSPNKRILPDMNNDLSAIYLDTKKHSAGRKSPSSF